MNPSHEPDYQPNHKPNNHQPDHRTKTELINWRRNKIIELKAQGHNQEEIAQILQVSPALISADFQFMRKEAMENIREYTIKELPLQFKAAIAATQNAIKEYWQISQNTKDNREKMQALESHLECHRKLCSMLGHEVALQSIFDNGSAGGAAANHFNDFEYRLSHDENGRHYEEGESVHPKGYGSFVYTSSPSHLKWCNEKHDITEQQIEKMKTKYYDVTEQDIEIKARWWCYNNETNTKNSTIST